MSTKTDIQISIPSLIHTIKSHLAKSVQSADKAEQHFVSAGLRLKELKARKPSETPWPEYFRETFDLGRSRADELIQIADGRTTVEKVRSGNTERSIIAAGGAAPWRSAVAAAVARCSGAFGRVPDMGTPKLSTSPPPTSTKLAGFARKKGTVRSLDPADPRNLSHPSHREQWLELARALGRFEAREEYEHLHGNGSGSDDTPETKTRQRTRP
jgi:hypothetical protein